MRCPIDTNIIVFLPLVPISVQNDIDTRRDVGPQDSETQSAAPRARSDVGFQLLDAGDVATVDFQDQVVLAHPGARGGTASFDALHHRAA